MTSAPAPLTSVALRQRAVKNARPGSITAIGGGAGRNVGTGGAARLGHRQVGDQRRPAPRA